MSSRARSELALDVRMDRLRCICVGGSSKLPFPVLIGWEIVQQLGIADAERALVALVVAGEEEGRAEHASRGAAQGGLDAGEIQGLPIARDGAAVTVGARVVMAVVDVRPRARVVVVRAMD